MIMRSWVPSSPYCVASLEWCISLSLWVRHYRQQTLACVEKNEDTMYYKKYKPNQSKICRIWTLATLALVHMYPYDDDTSISDGSEITDPNLIIPYVFQTESMSRLCALWQVAEIIWLIM